MHDVGKQMIWRQCLMNRSNNKFKEFTEILIKIANELIPKTSGKLNPKHKPWFNEDCKVAIANRKQAVKDFTCNPFESKLTAIKITRAKARRTIRQSKRDSWRLYISKLNCNTPAKKVWDMVRRISGKSQPSATHHLVVDSNRIEHPEDIANTIASTVSYNSTPEHYTAKFQKVKSIQEKRPVKFHSDNSESYNQAFSLIELQDAIRQAHDTAVGPDQIHYQMLKHLPEVFCSISLLLSTHFLWTVSSNFPPISAQLGGV
jgi:hypothetical protein